MPDPTRAAVGDMAVFSRELDSELAEFDTQKSCRFQGSTDRNVPLSVAGPGVSPLSGRNVDSFDDGGHNSLASTAVAIIGAVVAHVGSQRAYAATARPGRDPATRANRIDVPDRLSQVPMSSSSPLGSSRG